MGEFKKHVGGKGKEPPDDKEIKARMQQRPPKQEDHLQKATDRQKEMPQEVSRGNLGQLPQPNVPDARSPEQKQGSHFRYPGERLAGQPGGPPRTYSSQQSQSQVNTEHGRLQTQLHHYRQQRQEESQTEKPQDLLDQNAYDKSRSATMEKLGIKDDKAQEKQPDKGQEKDKKKDRDEGHEH